MLGKQVNLNIQEKAEDDLYEYWEQYETKNEGLGDRFIDQVYLCFDRIEANPEVYQVRYDNIRCGIVDRFPFLVHYRIAAEDAETAEVQVLEILPQASDWG